jgi:energy-converting hydrogenase Eha subunit B
MTGFADKLFKLTNLAERVFLAGAIIAILLKRLGSNSDSLLILSLTALAILYFLSAYKPQPYLPREAGGEQEKWSVGDLVLQAIAPKVGWIGCSVATIGTLFYLQEMKGKEQMLILASVTLAIVNILLGISFFKGNKLIGQLLMRTVPLCLMAFYLLSKLPWGD